MSKLEIVRKESSLFDTAYSNCDPSWRSIIKERKDDLDHIESMLKSLYPPTVETRDWIFYPEKKDLFRVLTTACLTKIKVLIFGVEPYPILEKGKPIADGLAFSTNGTITPSLAIIFDEVKRSYPEFVHPETGSLLKWASQGVMLLNTSLTYQPYKETRSSHANLWLPLVYKIIATVTAKNKKMAICFLGRETSSYKEHINGTHLIIETSYPSAMGHNKTDTPFTGSNMFKKINNYLQENGKTPIDWNLA